MGMLPSRNEVDRIDMKRTGIIFREIAEGIFGRMLKHPAGIIRETVKRLCRRINTGLARCKYFPFRRRNGPYPGKRLF